MKKVFLIIPFIIMMGLLLWNIYLTAQVKNLNEEIKDHRLMLDMCEGDLQVLTDDLVTAQDSLRILKK